MTNLYRVDTLPIIGVVATTAGSTVSASISGLAGRQTYITGLEATWGSQTTAGLVPVTITNLLGPNGSTVSLTYNVFVSTATLANNMLNVQFTSPLPASTGGTGGTVQAIFTSTSTASSVAMNLHGFYI
jgi:hypothetical protein